MMLSVRGFVALSIPMVSGLTVLGGCGAAKTGGGGGGGDGGGGGGGSDGGGTAASANAGGDLSVLVGDLVNMDGSSSVGATTLKWLMVSRPAGSAAALTGASTLTPTFTPDVEGEYKIELAINDRAAIDTATITASSVGAIITVPDGSAIVIRTRFGTPEYAIDMGKDGVLSGESSVGNPAAALVIKNAAVTTYKWVQVGGPTVTIVGGDTNPTLTFTTPSDYNSFLARSDRYKWQVLPVSRLSTTLTFRLTVGAANGNTASESINIFLQDNGNEIHTQSGVTNVGLNRRTILCGPSLNGSTDVQHWNWTLTPPAGSAAAFEDTGTSTSTVECPKFTPDVTGVYTVAYDSVGADHMAKKDAATPIANAPGTLLINAADYVGVGTITGGTPAAPECATCHGNPPLTSALEDEVTEWQTTKHSHIFEDNMGIYQSLAPEPYLWEFNTVGYNHDADSAGFDDLAGIYGYTFPAAGETYADFVSRFPEVAKLSNVQCENCHGPGSRHDGSPNDISKSFSQAAVCGQCHIQEAEWKNSKHNEISGNATSGWLTNKVCTRCHTTKGFVNFEVGGQAAEVVLTGDADAFGSVGCAACHDPHDRTNDFQLRQEGTVTMASDVPYLPHKVVEAGLGAVCYECHMGNRQINEADCDSDANGQPDTACLTWDQTAIQYAGGGFHDTAQSAILEGVECFNDLNGDSTIDFPLTENSFHTDPDFILSRVTGNPDLSNTNNKCVTCHMAQRKSPNEEGYLELGGHGFAMKTADGVEQTQPCQLCHGDKLTEINRPARADYDGNGHIDGIQDEVIGLLINLTKMIKAADGTTQGINHNTDVVLSAPDKTFAPSGGTSKSGTFVQTDQTATNSDTYVLPDGTKVRFGALGINGNSTLTGFCSDKPSGGRWTDFNSPSSKQGYRACNFNAMPDILKRAYWNHNSIKNDESLGIHNAAYTIQVLQGTYAAIQYLMSIDKNGAAKAWGTTKPTYQTDFPLATLR